MADSCPQCGLRFSAPSPASCPNCGENLRSELTVGAAGGLGLITGYFRQVWLILTHPSAFFRSMPVRGGVAGPLAFALVTHWLGSAVAFLWRTLIGGAVGGYLSRFMQMAGDVAEVDSPGRQGQFTGVMEIGERIQHWIWGAGAVIADPFITLARILFISFLVWLGARLLVTPGRDGAPREIDFESALRVICYGLTPSILAVLPLFGGFVSMIYVVAVTVIGAREVYRVETGRAFIIALFPQFLLFAFVAFGLFAMLLFVVKLVATSF